MKKQLPVIILLAGVVVVAVAFLAFRSRTPAGSTTEDEGPDLPVSQRPYTQLIPTDDGHYLNLIISNINVPNAASMDYELYYDTADNITQGVPGKINLDGKDKIERELLLGSESSGKFRYDQGVNDGTLTLRFRDKNGKMIGKVAGQWALLNNNRVLSSLDGKFSYTLNVISDAYFVVMPTFGVPSSTPAEVISGPYGVFSSSETGLDGVVDLSGNVYRYDSSSWQSVSKSSTSIGVFVGTN